MARVHNQPCVEVLKLRKDINPMKSSGTDKFSSKVCKDAFLALMDMLVQIFNCSLFSNIFPTFISSQEIRKGRYKK